MGCCLSSLPLISVCASQFSCFLKGEEQQPSPQGQIVRIINKYKSGFPGGTLANVGDTKGKGSIPGFGRSPGEGNGNPLQYSCLENPMDRGAWRATVHGLTKSRT